MADEMAELAEEASIMMENAEMNFAAQQNGHFERGPVTPPEPEVTEPSTSVLNGPPTEEEGTETFIGTDSVANVTDQTKSDPAPESDGEISSHSENENPTISPPKRGKKRSHKSPVRNEVKTNNNKFAVPRYGWERANYLFSNNGSGRFQPVTRVTESSRAADRTPEPSDLVQHPLIKTLKQVRHLSLPAALDLVFSIPPTEIALLNMNDMLEVLDLLKALSERRQKLTANRVLLTREVRHICDQEVNLLTDLEHVMTQEERGKFEQLQKCPPSMDELAPFETDIDPKNVKVASAKIRIPPVDLLPPTETPLIGQHDPSWDVLVKHIPMELRGVLPAVVNVEKVEHVIHGMDQPPPNAGLPQATRPQDSAQPFSISSFDTPVAAPINVQAELQQTPAEPGPLLQQPPGAITHLVPPPNDMTVPPPNLGQPPPASLVPQPATHLAPDSAPNTGGSVSPISAFRQSLKPALLSSLVNTTVPPPNVSIPPPGLDPLMPQSGGGPHSLAVPLILQQPPPVPAPPGSGGPPVSVPNVQVVSGADGMPTCQTGSPGRFALPPPQAAAAPASRPMPLMSMELPPGFVPRINQARPPQTRTQKPRNKPSQSSSTSTPNPHSASSTQAANSPAAPGKDEKPEQMAPCATEVSVDSAPPHEQQTVAPSEPEVKQETDTP